MNNKIATVIGSTGLVGSHIVDILKNDSGFGKIRLLVRRPVSVTDSKIEVVVIDFEDLKSFKEGITGSDAVFCAIGTTNKKVKGDRAAYRKVDYDIPVNAARFCEETGCQSFAIVSSVGADSRSNTFYLKIKGEVEDFLKESKIKSISVFRPSMLMGKRSEFRFLEEFAKVFMRPVSFLFPSQLEPVNARNVALAMIKASEKGEPGFKVYHYREIMDFCSK